MKVVSRPALALDTSLARTMHHQAYKEVAERQFGPWDVKAQDDFFADNWASGEFEILVCDDVPCGYLCVEHREDDFFIRELVLIPGFQGRGIGSEVLHGVTGRARQSGVSVRLETCHMNRAVNLYRRLGFREVGQTDTHILMEWRVEAEKEYDAGPEAAGSETAAL